MQVRNEKMKALVWIAHHLEGPELIESAFEVFRRNLDAFEGGLPMINVFDRERGY